MSLLHAVHLLKAPLVAIAFCALLAQQMVGFVLTVSPAMAYELGFSLCLSGPPPSGEDPVDIAVHGAGFCPCTMQHAVGLLSVAETVERTHYLPFHTLLPSSKPGVSQVSITGPPPARAPPLRLHSV